MRQVLMVGSPNSGKSLLFNRLTGLQQKVANFPGVTVSTSAGHSRHIAELDLIDFPGVYSLQPLSGEEAVAVDAFHRQLRSADIAAVLCVLDVTRLEKSLLFALQVIDAARAVETPVVLAANMMDTLRQHGLNFDAEGLAADLGVPVVPLSARRGDGVAALEALLADGIPPLAAATGAASVAPSEATELLATDGGAMRERAEQLAQRYGPQGDLLVRSTRRADGFFLNTVTGGISFFLIMGVLFQAIFTWAAPLMDGVETLLQLAAAQVVPAIGIGWIADFVNDALFGGLGAFLVFVPQIFILTLLVGLMEDSGYLARAAVICHRPLRMFGLTGKSFVPMLSGVACAIPGIYAARTVESPYRRWLTWLAIPLMPCSARLPVYALLIAAFIPDRTLFGGWLGLQGLAMLGMYLFGIVVGLLVTALVSWRRADKADDGLFVLELPPYRLPDAVSQLRSAWQRSRDFIYRAGPVIFWVTMVVWVLGYLPNGGSDLSQSWLGQLGRFIQPVFEPLGVDWRYGVAILASFLAREVFVGTLGTLFGIADATDNVVSLADRVQADGLSMASGFALLVFFAIAAQCVSTLATLRQESGSWKLPLQMFVAYSILAYIAAWLTFQLVSVLAA